MIRIPGVRRAAARTVLTLYPPAVRERYGPEIRDLLAASHRPMRDTWDVARTGLDERFATLTPDHGRAVARFMGRTARTLVIMALAAAPFLIFLVIFPPLSALAAGALGAFVGDKLPRWWWLPTTATAALVGVLVLNPSTYEAFGNGSAATPFAVWLIGTAALVALVWRLPGGRARGWTALLGGLTVLHLAAVVQVLPHLDAVRAPREYALGWYWSTIVPLPLNLGGPGTPDRPEGYASFAVPDLLELTPPLLTVVLAFVLALVCQARSWLVDRRTGP